MTTKLNKLLEQVAQEKARIKADKIKQERKQIDDISALVVAANLVGVPHDFLRIAFAKIAEDYAATGANSHE